MSLYYTTLMAGLSPSFLSNVIAAYKFENNGNDSHINAFDGTVGTSVAFSTTNAVDGLAGQFINNTNSRITIVDNDAFTFSNGVNDTPFSIKANVSSVTPSLIQPIFSKWNGSNSNASEYLFYLRAPTGRLALLLLNNVGTNRYLAVETQVAVAFVGALPTNVVVTYDGSGLWTGIRMYINGVLQAVNNFSVGSYTAMGNTAVTPIIGNRSSGSNALVGTVDELYVFNSELTQVQVDKLQTNYYPDF